LSAFFIIMPMSSPITFESSFVGFSVKPFGTAIKRNTYLVLLKSKFKAASSKAVAARRKNLFWEGSETMKCAALTHLDPQSKSHCFVRNLALWGIARSSEGS
jgi:hypothetical protein